MDDAFVRGLQSKVTYAILDYINDHPDGSAFVPACSESPGDRWRSLRNRLGINLIGLRTDCNFTQEQVAEATGLSRNIISRIEQGDGNPKLETLLRLASHFDVGIGELVGEV